jgi:hypothetical protein
MKLFNIKLYEIPFSGSRVVAPWKTCRHDEASRRIFVNFTADPPK